MFFCCTICFFTQACCSSDKNECELLTGDTAVLLSVDVLLTHCLYTNTTKQNISVDPDVENKKIVEDVEDDQQ